MATANRDLMTQARESLKGHWAIAVTGNVIYIILMILFQSIPRVGWIGTLIIGGPYLLGYSIFFLSLSRKQEPRLAQLFEGFYHFANALVAYLLMTLFIILWTLLFIIPGFVATLSYSQTFFILADDPQLKGSGGLAKEQGHDEREPLEAVLPSLEIFWMVPAGNPKYGNRVPVDRTLSGHHPGPFL